jgi:acyl carrier protein
MTSEPVLNVPETVRRIIAEVLRRPLEEVQSNTNLMYDLDVESIDLLDIVFRIESCFSIQITRGALERAARGDMTDDDFAPDGIISEQGLERLRKLLPESADRIQPGLRPIQIPSLFTVQTFVNIVETARASKS